jgi:hypothetical protein
VTSLRRINLLSLLLVLVFVASVCAAFKFGTAGFHEG